MIYKINTTVKSVEFLKRNVRGYMGADGRAVIDTEPLGWFVCFEGSWERLHMGNEKPALVKGQKVEIIIKGL
jgi:hypothetical protein